MNALEQLIFSGGGFIAGVSTTIAYAKATGNRLEWPWKHKNSHGFKSKIC